jgi:hypothetical protein
VLLFFGEGHGWRLRGDGRKKAQKAQRDSGGRAGARSVTYYVTL